MNANRIAGTGPWLAVACVALASGAPGWAWQDGSGPVPFAAHDALPAGEPADLAAHYYAADDVPGVARLNAAHRRSLLDVVTTRYKNRLADRAGVSAAGIRSHLDRLSRSALATDHPLVVAQTCAQFGVEDGVCAAHRGYVRRARLLEEMLASGRLTLGELETELVGAPRPSLTGPRSAR